MKKISMESMMEFSFLSGLKIGPEGKILYRVSKMNEEKNRYDARLFILDGERNFPLTSTKIGGFFQWDEDEVIFSAEREEKKAEKGETRLYRISTHGGEAKFWRTFPFDIEKMDRIDEEWFLILASWSKDKYGDVSQEEKKKKMEDDKDYEVLDEIPFWLNGAGFTNKKRSRLFAFNIRTEDVVAITDEFTQVHAYDWDKNRREVLVHGTSYMDKMPLYSKLERISIDSLESKEVGLPEFMYQDAYYFDGGILFTGSDGKEGGVNQDSDIYTMDLEGDHIQKISPEDWNVSMWNSLGSDMRYGSGYQSKVLGDSFYFITTEFDSTYLNKINKDGKIERVTKAKGSVDFFDIKEGKLVLCALRDQKLQELYLVEEGEEKQVTFHNRVLESYAVAVPEAFSFSSEGEDFVGYVLKPKDYDKTKHYPGILAIHGGPKTAYGTVFYHEMQFFAAQGYMVFFTNPTGSDGLGRRRSDIRGQYGEIDYRNLMDFTSFVLKRYPNLDSDRLGVMGGSYGGFMCNWIIGHTDRFAAAASQRSISNWISKFGITDIGYYFVDDQQGGATPWDGVDTLWAHSPLKYANQCKTPTLFIHSDEDYRCHLSCGLQMFTALKYHGVDAKLVLFHGENHELSRSGKPKHRLRRLKEIYDWFEHYVK